MRICFVGDIVALPGKRAVESILPGFLKDNQIDICIANAENSAGGLGVSSKIADSLFDKGVDCITLGNHAFSNFEFIKTAGRDSRIIRPANVNEDWPGFDYTIVEKGDMRLGVINLEGQVDITPTGCDPYKKADRLMEEIKNKGVKAVFIDFHAEATSEKAAFAYHCAGKASVVVGTHTHVQTADERILRDYTGFITDAGMSGCIESVIGMDIDCSLRRLRDKLPGRYEAAMGEAFMCGIIAEVDKDGRCTSIKRFCEYE
ncbi:hypothetical protein SAMN06296952_0543 [Oscillospiraceae bacterium]|nr:hypothetical protein SAMN06296952_0543 [Oscillospiraceae bacterium]